MRRIAIAAMAALCLTGGAAKAENLTGNQLFPACNTELGSAGRDMCFMYYAGVFEGLWAGVVTTAVTGGITDTQETNMFASSVLRMCVPPGATHKQIADVATQALIDNPQSRHNSARFLALIAWQKAFPCPK